MTLVVGILCSDGVVLAADSEATLGSAGAGQTAAQRTAHKLIIQHDKVIIGASGFVGLAQRTYPVIRDILRGKFGAAPEKVSGDIRNALVPIVKPEYEMSQLVAEATRNMAPVQYAVFTALIALPVQDKPCLLQVYDTCATEYSSADLPFAAIGSGQRDAEPFLAFLRRLLWPTSGLPSVADGLFSALWTVQHVIDITSRGIGGDIQLATLTKDANNWVAHELSAAERETHREAVESLRSEVLKWRSAFGAAPATPAPAAPPQ